MITDYVRNNQIIGYRVAVHTAARGTKRRFFLFKHYETKAGAKRAALKCNKEFEKKHGDSAFNHIFTPNGRIVGLVLKHERNGMPYLVAQARYYGDKITVWRSLNTNDWETAFEELVSKLLIHRRIKLTSEIALEIEKRKRFYDPSRKSNWKPKNILKNHR